MRKKVWMSMVLFLMVGSIAGCSTIKVKRIETDKVIDLSGKWNDTDSRLVAEEMIKDCVERPWLNKFEEKSKREPVVIVGTIMNRSHEHINSQLFIKDLERSLINSGMVKFVASKEERQEVREERISQNEDGMTDKDTIKPVGYETGADFMLQGSINSVKDEIKGRYVILYQVSLELIDLTTNQKVWIGEKEIKKSVKKGKFVL